MTTRPVSTRPIPVRVVVVGCAGSGKTTLAREVAARLNAQHIERDAVGDDEAAGFAVLVAAAVGAAGRRWVFDGAPYNAEAQVYPHADALVALDYPHPDRMAPRHGSFSPALAYPAARRSTHRLPALEVVDADPPGGLVCADACRAARGKRRLLAFQS